MIKLFISRIKNIRNKNLLLKKIFENIGFTATLFGFYAAFFPISANIGSTKKIVFIISFLVLNSIVAVIMSLPKSKVEIVVSNKIKVNIFFGDLFKADNNIVLPFNEFFDMDDNDELNALRTLHGRLIHEVYDGDVGILRDTLQEKLSGIEPKKDGILPTILSYKIGTTLQIEERGKRYFLLAFTNFKKNNKENLSIRDYQTALTSLWEYLHSHSQGEEINIPLLGGAQAGVQLTKQELLECILSSIKFHDNITISGGINIILHESVRDEIDLNNIQFKYKYGEL